MLSDRAVLAALNQEWAEVVAGSRGGLPAWAGRAELRGCRDLDEVLRLLPIDPDPVLLALLEAAAEGSPLAGRTVLQAMLGKLVRMALADTHASLHDYLAGLWCVATTYPLDRRRTSVAANLALDTRKLVRREVRCRREPAGSFDALPPGRREQVQRQWRSSRGAAGEVMAVLHAASILDLIDDETGAMLHTVYVEGFSSAQAAHRHGGSAEMVRYRCSRALRRLAGHATSLAEAA